MIPPMRFSRSRKVKPCSQAFLSKYRIRFDPALGVQYAMRCVICTKKLKQYKRESPAVPSGFDYTLFEAGKSEKGGEFFPFSKHWSVLLRACWPKKEKYPF